MEGALRKMTASEVGHDLRKRISEVIKWAKAIKEDSDWNQKGQRELALVITKLEEAKMWGGKFCGETGEPLPEGYPHDNAA